MKTKVIFRKFRSGGDILALFPEENANNDKGCCMSYQHIGQHGAASYGLTEAYTVPAKQAEYRELLNELIVIGYDLKIGQRVGKRWFQV